MTDPVIAQVTGQDLLARLDTLSTNMATLTVKLDDVPRHITDHEARIRVLERALWKAAGAAGAIAGLFGGGVGALIALVGHR